MLSLWPWHADMVVAEISVYGAKAALLHQWRVEVPSIGHGLAWCREMTPHVDDFCRANDAHFVDQHVYDSAQDARNR